MNNSLAITKISASQIEFSVDKKRNCDAVLETVTVPMLKLPKRILFSFTPPLNYNAQYLYTDYLGPSLSTLVLVSLLQYGFSQKKRTIRSCYFSSINVICIVLSYYVILSLFTFIASRIVRVKLKFLDIITLIGYSFYGYIVTLAVPLVLSFLDDHIFYFCLILFSGLSCMRVVLILLFAIEKPIARFLICSLIGNTHLLFVIYLYYNYIHPTYIFGSRYP